MLSRPPLFSDIEQPNEDLWQLGFVVSRKGRTWASLWTKVGRPEQAAGKLWCTTHLQMDDRPDTWIQFGQDQIELAPLFWEASERENIGDWYARRESGLEPSGLTHESEMAA